MLRLGWAETKILFCVRLSNMLSPAQQGVVPAPIQISLVVWFLDTLCARSLVLEHRLPILPFFIGGGVTLHERLVGPAGPTLSSCCNWTHRWTIFQLPANPRSCNSFHNWSVVRHPAS